MPVLLPLCGVDSSTSMYIVYGICIVKHTHTHIYNVNLPTHVPWTHDCFGKQITKHSPIRLTQSIESFFISALWRLLFPLTFRTFLCVKLSFHWKHWWLWKDRAPSKKGKVESRSLAPKQDHKVVFQPKRKHLYRSFNQNPRNFN